jgi:hypothetical protein
MNAHACIRMHMNAYGKKQHHFREKTTLHPRSCTYRANLLQITTPARSCTYRANLTDHDHRRGRVLIEPIYRSRPPARSCTYRANLQITTTGAVVYLSSQPDRSRPPARSCTYRANLQITTPARSCTYRANLLQITTPARSCTYRANLTDHDHRRGRVLIEPIYRSRHRRGRGRIEANLIDLIDVSESSHNAPAKHINPYSRRPWLGFTGT